MLQATWIVRVDRNGKVYRNEFECSNCGEVVKGKAVKYCKNCKAQMQGRNKYGQRGTKQ